MTDLDRPNLTERYTVAVGDGANTGVILAAGLSGSDPQVAMGFALLRMQSEFDVLKGELLRTSDVERDRKLRYAKFMRAADSHDADADRFRATETSAMTIDAADRAAAARRIAQRMAAKARADAYALTQRTPNELASLHLDAIQRLTLLHDASARVFARALQMADKRGINKGRAAPAVGRVLNVYLDPTCHHCAGTGKVRDTTRIIAAKTCPKCAGTGHRRDMLGGPESDRLFVRDLFAECQKAAAAAAAKLRAAMGYGTVLASK